MMKKIMIYILCAFFIAAISGQAIDKTVKKENRQETEQADTLKNQPTDKDKANNIKQNTNDYNDFVDKNNNGIDDRAETTKKVAPEDSKDDSEKSDK